MSETAVTTPAIELLNTLLRGEISAQQAHEKALTLAADMKPEDVAELRLISAEHARTAEILRTEVFSQGGVPAGSSGAWGAFAKAFQSSANMLGVSTAVSSLLEGEEHGLKEYEGALGESTGTARALLEERLIPNQKRHIAALGAFGTRKSSD
jgi:hypothetical protein